MLWKNFGIFLKKIVKIGGEKFEILEEENFVLLLRDFENVKIVITRRIRTIVIIDRL